MVQERVLDRLPHALVRHPARGMDVGEGEVRFVASFDQREVAKLDALPEGLVFGDRRQRLAQAPRERVRADAVHRQSAQAQIERGRGVAPLEGGLREVRDVARLDVVGVELGEDPARDEVGPLVDRSRRGDAVRVLLPFAAHGDEVPGEEGAPRRMRRHYGSRSRTGVQSSRCTRACWMTTVSRGTSWNMPREPVATAAIRLHRVHAFHHPAERRVAPALGGAGAVVQEIVVGDVDEELGGGGVGIGGSGHGDRSAVVLSAPVRFVADGRASLRLLELGGEPPALDHEARDHPVKDGAVVEPVTDVGEEVLHRLGPGGRIELQDERSVAGLEGDPGVVGLVPPAQRRRRWRGFPGRARQWWTQVLERCDRTRSIS